MDVVNLCLLRFCEDLTAVAHQRRLSFSMWVDDLAFSGDGAEHVFDDVAGVARRYGYRLKRGKKRIMRAGSLQEVTGLGVNADQLSNLRARREELTDRILEVACTGSAPEFEVRSIESTLGWMV